MMDIQFWCSSKLGRVDWSLRRWITFYAPLCESLDFMGIEPVTFTRGVGAVRTGRDGLTHSIGVNVPLFSFVGEIPYGLWMGTAGEFLQFSALNNLSDNNTLIWFENNAAKSTPTNTNPFASNGSWTGGLSVSVKHVCKSSVVLNASDIAIIQNALTDTALVIAPPSGPTYPQIGAGAAVMETPAGAKNGTNTVFTLSQNPDLNTLLVFCFGATLERVGSSPGNLQFTASGTGNKTLTLGLGPTTAYPFFAQYFIV